MNPIDLVGVAHDLGQPITLTYDPAADCPTSERWIAVVGMGEPCAGPTPYIAVDRAVRAWGPAYSAELAHSILASMLACGVAIRVFDGDAPSGDLLDPN